MTSSVNILQALGGLGLFLFSMRFLTQALNRSIARRLRPFIENLFATPARSTTTGLLSTLFLQASSITIIAAMGLIASSLITFEQGYYAMLGAVVGTTAKMWLFAYTPEGLGGAIIGLASLALVFVRRTLWRESLEIILAVGFTLFGLDLLATGLAPLAQVPTFQGWLAAFSGGSFSSQCLATLTGCLLTMAVQSSSTIVVLTMFLANQAGSGISLDGGICVVLGANVGTTLTPWLASLEFGPVVRRLAVAHIAVKAVGVLAALLVFPYVVDGVSTVSQMLGDRQVSTQLAIAHTGFNVVLATVFFVLGGLVLRLLSLEDTPASGEKEVETSRIVRRMLSRSPQRALDEADRQLKLVDRQTKALIEESLYLLLHDLAALRRKPDDAVFRRTFERQHEALHDLLMRLNRKTLSNAQRQALRFNLALLTGYGEMQLQALSLLRTLTEGQSSLGYVFPSPWRALVTDYQTAFDGAWLRVHYRSTIEAQEADQLRATCQALRERYFNEISGDVSVSPPVQSWLHDIISRLEQVAAALFTLAETAATFPDVHVPDVSEEIPAVSPAMTPEDDGSLEAEAV